MGDFFWTKACKRINYYIIILMNTKGGIIMDYLKLTAPCGLDCFNCQFYLANDDKDMLEIVKKIAEEYKMPLELMLCKGCRAHDGRIPLQLHLFGEDHRCAAYECSKEKGHKFCGDCEDFPCDNLQPYADKATTIPHNFKVYNLCLINKMGLEKWAETKSAEVRDAYFNKPWSLAKR